MDFSTTEEQESIGNLARQIFEDSCGNEHLAALERDESGDGIDHALWKSLAEAHLLGIALDEAHGGSDLGLSCLITLFEEAGRALAPVPLLSTLIYAGLPIAQFGNQAQKEQWLPAIASGEAILTAGFEEIGSSEPREPRTKASAQGTAWILDGEKACVPAAHVAQRILVAAATGPDHVGLFLVDPKAQGVEIETGLANNYERQSHVRLSGVRVEAEDVLGDPTGGAEAISWILDRAQVALAAMQLGLCQAAIELTARYTAERKQFGRAIGSFQAVTMRAADAYVDLECMKSTLWQAIWRLETGLPATAQAAAAKWWACRGGGRIVHTTQHLHGGTGADIDYPIHRYFLWAQQIRLTLGGSADQLVKIGEQFALA
ncbi:MAG: acyl-CoA dehydrogenase [Deltaproteobacteria bacterium]|nr:acyl-CoA dehydrogenase [Deltaproteobacteria bacterium]